MIEIKNRDQALKLISEAASYGNLGLFIGTGFSKAILTLDKMNAFSWGELLQNVCEKLDINYEKVAQRGVGFPEIATTICSKYAETKGKNYNEALNDFKHTVAELTNWIPTSKRREQFKTYFEKLSPSWIITTNYDLVIETLLPNSIALGPNDQISNPKNVIPIYHLHGRRTNPDELVITQEDYIHLFRPNEYRQIKLALTLKESTVLFMGYGLGDVDVLTAFDWSKNVFAVNTGFGPHDVIQVLRTNNPRDEIYRDRNGVLIIETDELTSFLEEYTHIRNQALAEEGVIKTQVSELLKSFQDLNLVSRFIDDETYRRDLIWVVKGIPFYLLSGFITFLDNCFNETWVRAQPKNAFGAYDENLKIVLDLLTGFNDISIPPSLLQTIGYDLLQLVSFIGPELGQSRAAYKTWMARKKELSNNTISDLKDYAKQHEYVALLGLLNSI